MNYAGIRKTPLAEAELAYMCAYLRAAVTASPQLKILNLDFYPYGIFSGSSDRDEDLLEPGPVFTSRTMGCGDTISQLTRVIVHDMALKSDELAPLLSRLGAKMSYLSMYNITLLDACWAPLLDAVRDIISQRCRVNLSDLLGAEFGNERREELDFFEARPEEWKERLGVPPLMQDTMDYVCGRTDINPLTKLGVDLQAARRLISSRLVDI
ncbi:hypothetical protein LMH87_000117 [Akanthomyces muscarius]|uniref:Uncharacterized protein n=1 Tax=Akanthomyces muscarius TaxID=2231603 RepID=A0A9W8QDX5_AKAMU|nr:hypothetical protein LMH87_000117 [Akanthomyces muscarius]KAJ4154842.1 hypothetical protein LMH87_000117 [Akanthomyces muscarius]